MAEKDIGGILADTTATGLPSEKSAANIAARLREVAGQADAALVEAQRTRWVATRDHTLIFAVEAVSDVTVNEADHTLTIGG